MKFIIVFLFYIVLLYSNVECAVDFTLVPEANSSAVVQAAIDKISQSAIFPNDRQMLRRIAFVETRDGSANITYSSASNNGGIWQVSEAKYLATKNTGSNVQLSQQVMKIEAKFNIMWLKTKWSDLRRPFYSALAARLYMQIISQSIPLASNVSGQGSYWALQFTSSRGIPKDYANAVTELQALENCRVSSLDLFFILDASGSVGRSNFQIMKDFVHGIVDSFDVASDKVRVGVMSFASSNSYHFHLNTHSNKSSVLSAINNLPYSGGGTNTAGALNGARIYGFSESKGTRPRSQGVPRVAVVITDGKSNSFSNTVTAAMALHNAGIIAFAVGIAGANEAELNATASQPSYVSFISSFNVQQLNALQISISQESCVVSPPVEVNETISDTIGEGEVKYINYQLDNETGITLKINVSNGSTVIYGSTEISTPSDVFYDFKIEAKEFRDIFIDPKIINKQKGLVTIYIAIIGQSKSNNFDISATEGDTSTDPVIVYSSDKKGIVIEHGQRLSISCTATGKPSPEMIWFKNKSLIIDDRITIQTNRINATTIESVMIIASTVSNDDGVYTCRGANVLPNGLIFNDSKSFTVCVITVNTSHLPFLNMTVRASKLNNVLDHSVGLLTPPIYFAGRRYSRLFVSSHGMISFGRPYGDYIPRLFPINYPVIAPFWDDSDLRGSGYVLFDVINKYTDALNIINETKNFLKTVERVVVDPDWVLVARWINVCPFQNRYCRNPRIKPNTVQLVLISQGTTSYAVFTYKCGHFEWTDRGATVGYSGNSNFYYNYPSSGMANITNIDCLGSPQSEWTNLVFNINI